MDNSSEQLGDEKAISGMSETSGYLQVADVLVFHKTPELLQMEKEERCVSFSKKLKQVSRESKCLNTCNSDHIHSNKKKVEA